MTSVAPRALFNSRQTVKNTFAARASDFSKIRTSYFLRLFDGDPRPLIIGAKSAAHDSQHRQRPERRLVGRPPVGRGGEAFTVENLIPFFGPSSRGLQEKTSHGRRALADPSMSAYDGGCVAWTVARGKRPKSSMIV
jgi:hypothetical protein